LIFIKSYAFSVLWLALILVLSFLPQSELNNKQVDGFDLVVHFVLYFVFTWLLSIANVRFKQFSGKGKSPVLKAFFISASVGIGVELLQGTVFVSRSMSFIDFLANLSGSLLAAAVFYLVFGAPRNYH
tara:strand:+ start:184 stop:567 length:384 start_codon:yes stop_codon:yes gene_type:complete